MIDAPGVVPEHHRHGLYRPLVLTAMQWLRSHGQHAIALQSRGDEQTISIYHAVGFELVQHFLAYRLDLG